jgi:hypothetical protein
MRCCRRAYSYRKESCARIAVKSALHHQLYSCRKRMTCLCIHPDLYPRESLRWRLGGRSYTAERVLQEEIKFPRKMRREYYSGNTNERPGYENVGYDLRP